MTRKAKTIKDVAREQFAYCKQIADDIVKHGASEAVQRHANEYAEVESPVIGGTSADWVRINYGGIYIFLEANEGLPFTLNGKIIVQLDFIAEYGAESIEEKSYECFLKCVDEIDEKEIWDRIRYAGTDFEYRIDAKFKREFIRDNKVKAKYVPFEEP